MIPFRLLSHGSVLGMLFVLSGHAAETVAPVLPALAREKIDFTWPDRATVAAPLAGAPDGKHVLWFRQPAAFWNEALPVGNGRLGAMVFGGVADERLQLNEDTLWDGYPKDADNPKALEALPEVRRLLFAGKSKDAGDLARQTMLGIPKTINSYQSLGELVIETGHTSVTRYRRTLDLATATATVSYESGGVTYNREVLSSVADNVIVVRFTASKKAALDLRLGLSRARDAETTAHPSRTDAIVLSGTINRKDPTGKPRGISFTAQTRAVATGGTVSNAGGKLEIRGADEVLFFIDGATTYRGGDPVAAIDQRISAASARAFAALAKDHRAAHAALFDRVSLDLGETAAARLPTDERIRQHHAGTADPALEATLFQFGRYLLISSSRPGDLPANLQGLWAWQMNAPWNADYHTNINVQMNYWPSEVANLSECHLPLFDLMEGLVKPGERTAKAHYGARGWVVHHLTDAWGHTAPADDLQGVWPMGSAWLALHPWEHYRFTGDREFLEKRGWPLMKGAARFMLDFLVEAPAGTPIAGKLTTSPSHSPENAFLTPDGQRSSFTYGATMDIMIIRQVLENCIAASKVLDTDADFRAECEAALAKLQPIVISPATGRIQEWVEDYQETDPKPPPRFASLRALPGHAHFARHPGSSGRRAQGAGDPRRRRHRLVARMESQLLGPPSRWRPRPSVAAKPARPRGSGERRLQGFRRLLSESLRRLPALPDRLELRRDRRHRRDVSPKPRAHRRRRDRHPSSARAAEGLANRLGDWLARPRRCYRGHRLEGWKGDGLSPPRTAIAASSGARERFDKNCRHH